MLKDARPFGMHIKRSRSGRWRTRDSLGRSSRARCIPTSIHSHEGVNCHRDVDLRPRSDDPPRWDNEKSTGETKKSSRGLYYAAGLHPAAWSVLQRKVPAGSLCTFFDTVYLCSIFASDCRWRLAKFQFADELGRLWLRRLSWIKRT